MGRRSTALVSRRIALAQERLAAGDLDEAAAIAQEVIDGHASPALSADALAVLATTQMWSGQPEEALSRLAAEARVLERIDPERSAELRSYSANLHMLRFEADGALATAHAACEVAESAGIETPTDAFVALAIAQTMNGLSSADDVLDTCALAIDDQRDQRHMGPLAWQLVVRERHDDARMLVERALHVTDAATHPGALALVLRARAEMELREGAWAKARADLLEALGLHRRGGHVTAAAYALGLLARLDAMEGRRDDCAVHAAEAFEIAHRAGALGLEAVARAAVGLDALANGEAVAAAESLDLVAAVVRRGRVVEPGFVPMPADHVEALLAAGRRGDAETAFEDLRRRAEASGLVWGRAVALRCEGLLALGEDVDDVFQRSLACHGELSQPFDRARTELAFGERLRRARRRGDARLRLRSALDVFEQLGAVPWSERARQELRAAGIGRRRAGILLDAKLTEQELRVARLAGNGETNREIASVMFISPKTVEFHLGNVYRKLGVRGRTQLARIIRDLA